MSPYPHTFGAFLDLLLRQFPPDVIAMRRFPPNVIAGIWAEAIPLHKASLLES
jgi:hypothetical protein